MSYAERLRQGHRGSAPASPTKQQQAQQQQQAGAEQPPSAAAAPEAPAAAPAPVQQEQQQAAAAAAVPVEDQPNASIFVRGIPATVTMEQLVSTLTQVGVTDWCGCCVPSLRFVAVQSTGAGHVPHLPAACHVNHVGLL